MTKKEIMELKNILSFLLDKIEECYQNECKNLVEEYIKKLN